MNQWERGAEKQSQRRETSDAMIFGGKDIGGGLNLMYPKMASNVIRK